MVILIKNQGKASLYMFVYDDLIFFDANASKTAAKRARPGHRKVGASRSERRRVYLDRIVDFLVVYLMMITFTWRHELELHPFGSIHEIEFIFCKPELFAC